jgi:hypothetical protein
VSVHLDTALALARHAVPTIPLRRGKIPCPNCPTCTNNRCGGRPNMKTPGPCQCPRPCHAWAAATFDPATLTSPQWANAWQHAEGVAYHPGGCGVTVLDLDDQAAIYWARRNLPTTRVVHTTRGQHWLYRGVMGSHNRVRPGIDIKSAMSYAVWRGSGAGTITDLPDAVRALGEKEETTTARALASSSRATWTRTVAHGCRHNEKFVRAGLDRGIAGILARPNQGAGTATYAAATFIARQHADCPGPCGAEQLADELIAAAIAVGVPEQYARRQVARGGLTQNGATQ